MIKSKQWLLVGCGLLISHFLFAQTTVTFTSDSNMSDAIVANGGVENQNLGAQNQLNVFHQVGQQIPMVLRTYIQYDLSSIPQNALITRATLALTTKSLNNTISHPIYIQRVENSTWYENTITWNNQPNGITSDQLSFSHAQTSVTGVHSFDLKKHVQYMVNNPTLNNGWRIRLQNESASSNYGIKYHSSEASNSSDRPVLTVEYIMPIELETTVEHCTAGNSDGALSVSISGGSGYTLSNMYFYKTITDTTQRGNATLSNVKATYNLQYNAGTRTITAKDLDPGVYIFRVLDDEYYTNSDWRFVFYKHILVGRDGEVTSGILIPNYQYQENVTIADEKVTNTKPIGRANTNYYSHTTSIPLRAASAPNNYEFASLVQYQIDFDEQLEFSKAELQIKAWSQFYRGYSSTNDVNYSLVTSPWKKENVTWNTRPTIDSTQQIYIPTTTKIGYDAVNIWDTLSLLPFVEYWQANPSENYGFEIALNSYNHIQYANRDYKSTAGNTNFVLFEFSVKQVLVAEFDDETNMGSLTVNAPSGSLPYTYLINTEPIGTLTSVWNEIKMLEAIDSLDLFNGLIDSTSYSFNNLPSGHYYVAVFDNTGTKILDEDAVVNTTIELYDFKNVTLNGDGSAYRTPAVQGDGTARIRAELLSNDLNGGIHFTIETLGEMQIGFNKSSQPLASSTSDLEFGISIASNGDYQIIENNVSLTSTSSISRGADIHLYRDASEYALAINGKEVYRNSISNLEAADISVDLIFGDATSRIKLINYSGLYRKSGISPKITYPECGEFFGDLVIYSGTGVSVIPEPKLKNNHTGDELFAVLIGGNYTFEEVPIGTYTLNVNYFVAPPPGLGYGLGYSVKKQIAIGYLVEWEDVSLLEEISYDASNFAIRHQAGEPLMGSANSTNRTVSELYNWIQFETQIGGGVSGIGKESIFFKEDEENIVGLGFQMGYGIPFMTSLIRPLHPVSLILSPNGVWRLEEEEGEFSIYKEGDVFAGAYSGDNGIYDIYISQFREAQYLNTVASFCNNYPIPDQFVEPKREIEGGYYLVPSDDLLRFEFNEEYALPGNLNYVVRDFKGQPQFGLADFTEEFGDNRLMLDVSTLSVGIYILEIINDKGENWFLRFKVQS